MKSGKIEQIVLERSRILFKIKICKSLYITLKLLPEVYWKCSSRSDFPEFGKWGRDEKRKISVLPW